MPGSHPPHARTAKGAAPVHQLDLRVHELGQLFNSMDPTPFLNKDLDRDAEAFIEQWAMGFSAKFSPHIVVHLAQLPADVEPAQLLTEAFHNHFNYKVQRTRQELHQLLLQGRTSALIGLAFVAICLGAADAIAQWGSGPAFAIARESLTIVGWVAMWRPLQIFLYDWWPMGRRIRVFKALGRAHIRVVQST